MATINVGQLTIDLDKVSDEDGEVLSVFENDGIMTDEVIEALARWSSTYGTKSTKDGEESKASKMRRLAAAGMSTGDIAKLLGVRFQFVYNVLAKKSQKAS